MRCNLLVLAAALLGAVPVHADEGMWLFNEPPRELLQKRFNFQPSQAWLDHLQKSSVRFNNGGSGSFVSPGGLILTNHHVGSDAIYKLSTAKRNYIETGFYAPSREQELKVPDLELNVLMEIEDVTARVKAAVKPGLTGAQAHEARQAVMNTIENESQQKTGLRSDVVTLYNGGQYHLYRYKRYTDVRLVFAPEKAIAFFGGDPDNFEFPRYDLDISFFRAYENGRPAQVKNHLKWSPQGAREGELVFVSGHPGNTDRLDTMRHLEFLRDRVNPVSLGTIRRREVALGAFGDRSLENARRAEDELFSYQNSRKARNGILAGLQDPSLMGKKRQEEGRLRDAVAANAQLKQQYGDAWEQVAAAIAEWDRIYFEHYLLERGVAFNGRLFDIARTLVRLTEETRKPNEKRLREYAEAGLESVKLELFSPAPIYKDLEIVQLSDSLTQLAETLGMENPIVRQVLAGKSPQERAADLVEGTRLQDVDLRKKLASAGVSGVNDPMIQLALLVDPPARRVRGVYEEKVQEPLRQAYAKIAGARFAAYGASAYPDATFTLRLAFGETKGYTERGKQVPWTTNIGGAYKHAADHGNREPYVLPKSWMDAKARLNPQTPFNFVSTADIIGGNSGSPVVNRAGEFVGIIFDGNIDSLVLDFIYTEERARAVAVHSAAITEALEKVYKASGLVAELRPRTAGSASREAPPPPAKPGTVTGCLDEQPGPQYVLRGEDELGLLMQLEPQGFPVTGFAKYLGKKVELRGRVSQQGETRTMKVTSIRTIAEACAP